MKVLHLTNKPIFPLLDGGCIAMHELLKNLLELGFEVKNLTIETSKHPFELDQYPASLRQIISPESVFIDTKIKAKDAFTSLFGNTSYNISRFYNVKYENKIIETLKTTKFQVIILESAYLLPYLHAIRKNFEGKVILRAHNVEFKIWEQLAVSEIGIIRKLFLKKLAKDLKTFEVKNLKKVDGIACVSENDLMHFKNLGISTPLCTIPVSMDFDIENIPTIQKNRFCFLGSMNWKPNIEAVDLLLNKIFPKILEQIPEAELHLAGSFMSDKLLNLKQNNVFVHGKVTDVNAFLGENGILLVPLKSGSGIRIKILEALSIGVPAISSTVGFEGIPIKNEIHGMIANRTKDFVEAAIFLASNLEIAKSMGQKGQVLVIETFNIHNTSKKLLAFIQSI
jgi:glycosyltransferase involved in cell wall biosynthesis